MSDLLDLMERVERDDPQANFDRYHRENPQVYRLVCRFASELIAAGHKRCSIKMIWERIRWHCAVETKDPQGFKLNNNYHAGYARLWLREHPEHPEFFRTRERAV